MSKGKNTSQTITGKASFFSVNVAEIWKYRDLIKIFIRRDFIAVYKQTVLGPLWHLITPLLSAVVYMVVFGVLFQSASSGEGTPKILFFLSGTVLWSFFSSSLASVSTTLLDNASIFGKVYFPRLAVPIALMVSKSISFFLQIIMFFVIYAYYCFNGTVEFNWFVLVLFPLCVFMIGMFSFGIGILISALTVKFRDFQKLIVFVTQLAMYASPVLYSVDQFFEQIPELYQDIYMLNPLVSIFETFRFALFGNGHVEMGYLLYSTITIVVIAIVGIGIFSKVEKNFIDTI